MREENLKHHRFNALKLGLVSAIALTGGQYHAWAQDADDAGEEGTRTLNRVTVTAQRRRGERQLARLLPPPARQPVLCGCRDM